MEAAMSIMSMSVTSFRAHTGPSRWSQVKQRLIEWRHRARSRYELMTLSERDLLDAGMTRTDAFNESVKPFWLE
jgi:uncharacterized protein YjiS (DUF1127 family)